MLCVCVFAWCLYIQVWAVSGELRNISGGFLECSPHRWASPGALHPTPLTKKSVQVINSVFEHFYMHTIFDICYLIPLCSLPVRR